MFFFTILQFSQLVKCAKRLDHFQSQLLQLKSLTTPNELNPTDLKFFVNVIAKGHQY